MTKKELDAWRDKVNRRVLEHVRRNYPNNQLSQWMAVKSAQEDIDREYQRRLKCLKEVCLKEGNPRIVERI